MILEIIITVLLGIISPTLTAYQYRKEKKTEKKRDTRIGASLWFIMISFLVYCIWSLGFKAIILILIYSATSFTCIYMFTKFLGFKSENFK